MRDPNQDVLDETGREPPPEFHRPLDLRPWLAIVVLAGAGALVVGQTELAVLTALAGLFALAHAADLDDRRAAVYAAVAWAVPAGSMTMFASLAWVLSRSDLPPAERLVGTIMAALGIAASLASIWRPIAHDLARTLFSDFSSSRVTRLAARLAIVGSLISVPAGLVFPNAAEELARSGGSLVGGAASLWSNLIGLVMLALGAVGFLVRRDPRATCERLGLTALRPHDAITILLGVAALVAVNAGAEWMQRQWFPALWASDQRVNQMIASGLSRSEILLLGLSAGIGEEIALRGALQPRRGVFRTSVLFALLHVQYSWFGMAIIALLGLTLGWIRKRSSTSVAITVHGLYDVAAVLTLNA